MTEEQEAPPEPNVGWTEALGEHASNPLTPRTTGYILALPDGREYPLKVSSVENRIKAQFEEWVRFPAERRAVQIGFEQSHEVGQKALSAYLGDLGSRAYNWDGRHCRAAREDWPGQVHLLFLCLKRCNEDIAEEEVGELWWDYPEACGAAYRWAMGNLNPRRRAGGQGQKEKNGQAGSSASPEQKPNGNQSRSSSVPKKMMSPEA